MSDLADKRKTFTLNLAHLVLWIKARGQDAMLEQVKRTEAEAAANAAAGSGISNSLHTLGLAADVSLFIFGVYQTGSQAYAEAGAFWKSLNPLNRWGGDFHDAAGKPKPDGNHFSMEHNGVK